MGTQGYHRPEMTGFSQPLRSEQIGLSILQQPERGKIVSRGKERDRRSIDPPPVVRLHVQNEHNFAGCSALNNPYLFCAVTLWKVDEDEPKRPESSQASSSSSSPGRPSLYGSTVSSLHRLKDLANEEGGFFVFGDVSAGCSGPARLKFCVYEMYPQYASGSEDWFQVIHLKSIISNKIEIANAKEWDGVKESTSLSRSFADQGVRLRLRKESRAASKRAFPLQGNMQPQMLRPMTSSHAPFDSQGQEHEDVPSAKRPRQNMPYSAYGQASPISSSAAYAASGSYSTAQAYQNSQQHFSPQAQYSSATTYGHFNDPYGRASLSSAAYATNPSSFGSDSTTSSQQQQYQYNNLTLNNAQYGSAGYPYVQSPHTQTPYFPQSASSAFPGVQSSYSQQTQQQTSQSPFAASTPQNPSYVTAIAPIDAAENTPRAQGQNVQHFRQVDPRAASRLPPIQQSQDGSENTMQYP